MKKNTSKSNFEQMVERLTSDGLIEVLYTTKPDGTSYVVYVDKTTGTEHRHTKAQMIEHTYGIAARAKSTEL